jgi:hydrogenase nickel incorporation protein HypB
MCDRCGCSKPHTHAGESVAHDHDQAPEDDAHRTVDVRASVLSYNDRLAEQNRGIFMAHKLVAVNLLSAPGSGKTAILESTAAALANRLRLAVIVGDLATDNDARRIRDKGVASVQITTGTACHLDAHMVRHALAQLDLQDLKLLFIENVGNLVCPAAFDLGEQARVVVMAVTEGEDKPLKYPVIFNRADVVLINKIDLAEAAGFDRAAALANIRRVVPQARVLEVSARTGAGMNGWYEYLLSLCSRTNGG